MPHPFAPLEVGSRGGQTLASREKDVVTAGTDVDPGMVATTIASSAHNCRGRVIWTPTAEDRSQSTLTAFMTWLEQNRGLSFDQYEDLWRWSITEPAGFWDAVWHFFGVEADAPYRSVMEGTGFQNTTWFAGARLNFARVVLRHEERLADVTAVTAYREDGSHTDWTWDELGAAVRSIATGLRAMGIQPGDRVAAYVPNVVEAAICFIATTAVGAVWSSCSPEFGAAAATDRFSQIEPKLLIAVPRYTYAGVLHDRDQVLRDLVKALPTLEHLVLLAVLAGTAGLGPAGWSVGVACAVTMAAPLARGLARGPDDRPPGLAQLRGKCSSCSPCGMSHWPIRPD